MFSPIDVLAHIIWALLFAIWRSICYVVHLLTGSLQNYLLTTIVAAPLFYFYAPSLGVGLGIIWACFGAWCALMDK